MASGGDSDDKRDPVSRRSLKDAHDEAARLIEGNARSATGSERGGN